MIPVIFLVFVVSALSLPTKDSQMMDLGNIDTALVESTIREVRAAPDSEVVDLLQEGTKGAYKHEYGDDGGDDVHGFHRRQEEEGSDGYKHFDSYHKKDGDKYGYEKHTAYGKAKKNNNDADGAVEKYQEAEAEEEDDGGDENAKYEDEDEAESGEETKNTYKVVEDVDEGDDGSHYTGSAAEDAGESGHYTDGDDSDSYHYAGDNGHYIQEGNVEGESDSGHENLEYDGHEGSDGESEHYTEAEDDDDDY